MHYVACFSYNEAADPSMIENFENPFYDVDNLEKNDHADGPHHHHHHHHHYYIYQHHHRSKIK
jgi:hypothetical protein